MNMELSYIYEKFKECYTPNEQKEFLSKMKELNLPYDINWDNLISFWEKSSGKRHSNKQVIIDEDDFEEEDIPFFE